MKNMKKVAALLLSVCLLITGIPFAADAAETDIVYDFNNLYNVATADNGWVDADGGKDKDLAEVDSVIATQYSKKNVNFDIEAYADKFDGKLFGSNKGMRTYSIKGQYIAFRMRKSAYATGTYSVFMQHDVSARGANVEVHILPVGTADIVGALNNTNRLGTVNFNSGNDNTDPDKDENPSRETALGTYTFGSETEFLVVFNMTEGSPSTGCTNQSYTFLEKLTFVPAKTVEYDFGDLFTKVDGTYVDSNANKKPDLPEYETLVRSLYNQKKVDIRLEGYSSGFSASLTSGDLKTYTGPGTYIAFRLRKNATDMGDYTVSMYHDVSARGGFVDMYILPVGTQDIPGALSTDNCVGRLDFNGGNENTNPDYEGNQNVTEVIGYHTFGDETEFLVVFKMAEGSPYAHNHCYTFLDMLTFTPGTDTPVSTPRRLSPMLVSEGPVEYFEANLYAAVGPAGDHYNLYLPIEGDRLNVYNLETREKLHEIVTPFDVCRGIAVDKDGIVWMVGSNPVVCRYDPFANTTKVYESFKPLAENQASSGFYLQNTDNYLYFGTYSGAHIVRFEKANGEYKVYGVGGLYAESDTEKKHNYLADAAYSCGVAADSVNGILYCGVAGDKDKDGTESYDILKIDIDSGYVLGSIALDNLFGKSEVMFRGMGLSNDGKTLFASASNCKGMICVDTETMTAITPTDKAGNTAYNKINFDVTRIGTDIYMSLGSTGASLDENGNCITYSYNTNDLLRARFYKWVEDASHPNNGYLEQVGNKSIAMRCGQSSYAKINGQDCLVFIDGNGVQYYDIENDTVVSLESMINKETDGAPILMQTLVTDENGNLYMGTFNTSKCRVYDVSKKMLTDAFYTSGQTDSMIWYKGELYAGNYNTGRLTRVNFDLQDSTVEGKYNDYLLGFKQYDGYEKDLENSPVDGEVFDLHQSRVHAIAAGDDKVFIGTIPDLYEFGGGIGWYDLKTETAFATRFPDENGDGVSDGVLEGQSIIGLAYLDGYLYGVTSTSGGTGSDEQDVDVIQGKLFVYDVANKKVVFESNLIKELADKDYTLAKQKAITVVKADPNGGKLWCIAGPYLFDFTYANGAITIGSVAKHGDDSLYSGHKASALVFDDDYIYAGFPGTVGMMQISRSDISQSTVLPVPVSSYCAIAGDGNLYYTNAEKLYMYPLNVTSEDHTAASEVTAKIAALPVGNAVVVADEVKINAAQNAYDALSTTQRALVSNYYLLREAYIDLLEAKIDTLNESSTPVVIAALMDEYESLSATDKMKVKNYPQLKAAFDSQVLVFFSVGNAGYADWETAAAAASKLSGDEKVVKLVRNTVLDELLLTDGIILDLDGYTLTVNAFNANVEGIANGYVVDSSIGNNGLLQMARTEDVFVKNNPDLPVYDALSGGYRLFDYKLELHATTTNIGPGREKFWFKFHFYTDDTMTALDQDAYTMLEADGSNMMISVDLTWQDIALDRIYYGRRTENGVLSTDIFTQEWATGATGSRWLYLNVSGLDKTGFGVLNVKPVITVNNVEVTNGVITYEKKMAAPEFGWDEDGPIIH